MTHAAYDGLNLWRAAFIQVIAELPCILNAMQLLCRRHPRLARRR